MDNPISGKKDSTFSCPSCGEMLSVESKDESNSEHENMKPKPKVNAGNMAMGMLRSKITQPTTNPPATQGPNLNAY